MVAYVQRNVSSRLNRWHARASEQIQRDDNTKRLGKRKFDSECWVFNQKWTSAYFFVQCKEVAVCLICQETVSVFKEYNLRRHYETHQIEKYASLQGQIRADKVSKLKSVLSTQQNMFVRQTQLNQSSVRASFQVAKLIATSGRPFSDGEFVKKCMNAVAEEVYPDKKDVLNAVSLSASTITRRIEEMGFICPAAGESERIRFFCISTGWEQWRAGHGTAANFSLWS